MQKNNHIKALFFLGIFSVLLFHHILPHWHHEHDVEHTHKAVANSDTHSHHHDVPEKESSKKEFLDLFLDIHVHSISSNEILLTQENSVKQLNVKRAIAAPILIDSYNIPLYDDEAEKISFYHPPNIYFKKYLSSLYLRGPPSLG
jgi:zinc transporter ZupT